MKLKEAELKLKDNIIASKDKQFNDLQAAISELKNIMHVLRQNIELVNNEYSARLVLKEADLISCELKLKVKHNFVSEYRSQQEIHE